MRTLTLPLDVLTHDFCEAAQPAWFAPIQAQLDNVQVQLDNVQVQLNNQQQQLNRMETAILKVCRFHFEVTVPYLSCQGGKRK